MPFLTVLTYNILNPYHAVEYKIFQGLRDGGVGLHNESNWDERGDSIIKNMQSVPFDIAALQEISPDTLSLFQRNFEIVHFEEHFVEIEARRHGNVIISNPETMLLLRCGALKSCIEKFRVGTWADFRHKESKKVFRAISVHLKGYNGDEKNEAILDQSKTLGYEELKGYLKEVTSLDLPVDGIFIAGDMNEHISENGKPKSRNDLLRENGFVNDNITISTEPRTGRCIDYIYYKGLGKLSFYPIHPPYPSASDHLPRASTLYFPL